MVRRGKALNVKFVADMSDCLDKYKVFGIEELRQATDGFDERWVIQGSVYKGCIDGVIYVIKKMKWNACEELKILQKVNIKKNFIFAPSVEFSWCLFQLIFLINRYSADHWTTATAGQHSRFCSLSLSLFFTLSRTPAF
ncbi:Serine/threonine receptor-like kinase NFP [Camellia lanceoleosa]|uniref:Serine/threonine receptor-like kinase NFP n=1 Tax=Camellia lanceoleosa TaxID=1840588 RepID=A0ACC0IMY2_9ERIC|nr:Serine/threonine receptor-like kinase NFP [Camellia lanceoleosa]